MTQEEKLEKAKVNMDYEKKYNEALERAKQVHKYSSDIAEIKRMEDIFPELTESEDERIRKAIKYCIKQGFIGYGKIENVTPDECLAWLEKQGEKKPIEWKDSDEKYLFWALLSIQKDIAASEINGVNTKDLNDCVKWLYSLKQRIG